MKVKGIKLISKVKPSLLFACAASIFVIIFAAYVKYRRQSYPKPILMPSQAMAEPIKETFTEAGTELAVCNNTYMKEITQLLTPEQCDRLRLAAQTHGMEESRVGETENELDMNVRKSTQVWFPQDTNAITEIIAAEAMDLVKSMQHCFGDITTKNNFEDIQIVRYEQDGKYDPHYDGTECNGDDEDPCLKNQRIATLLIYLNDDFEGGATRFPNLDVSIKPKKGNAVFFWVSDPATGLLYKKTLHGGDPVLSGEKWIATQWIRRNAK
jgi:prolyl 4-hydroxylase